MSKIKAIVISPFKDKENKEKLYKKNDIFEADKKRVEYLQGRKYLGEIVEDEPNEEPKEAADEVVEKEEKPKKTKKGK